MIDDAHCLKIIQPDINLRATRACFILQLLHCSTPRAKASDLFGTQLGMLLFLFLVNRLNSVYDVNIH